MTDPRADEPAHHPPPIAARYLARRVATRAAVGNPGERLRWLIVWWRGGGGPGAGDAPPDAPGPGDRSSGSPPRPPRSARIASARA